MQIVSSKKLEFRRLNEGDEELFTTSPDARGKFGADVAQEAPDWIKGDPYYALCEKSGWIVDFGDKSKLVETPQGFVHKDLDDLKSVPCDQADKLKESPKKEDKPAPPPAPAPKA